MDQQSQPGWRDDPLGIHKKRWWTGSQWTDRTTDVVFSLDQSSNEIAEVGTASSENALSTELASSASTLEQQSYDKSLTHLKEERYPDGSQLAKEETTKDTPSNSSQNATSKLDEYPALKNWETSVGFSFLGLICTVPLYCIVILAVAFIGGLIAVALEQNFYIQQITAITVIVWTILNAIYALLYYSYFSTEPLIKSPKIISFANLLFGGFIFGCIWNSNLTSSKITETPKAGISAGILVVFSTITLFRVLSRGYLL